MHMQNNGRNSSLKLVNASQLATTTVQQPRY